MDNAMNSIENGGVGDKRKNKNTKINKGKYFYKNRQKVNAFYIVNPIRKLPSIQKAKALLKQK